MSNSDSYKSPSKRQNFLSTVIILLALIVFVITWVSMEESQSDSLQLLVSQGEGFIESLTITSKNAIESENFYDFLVHLRFREIVIEVSQFELNDITEEYLTRLTLSHGFNSILVYRMDSSLAIGSSTAGGSMNPPDYILNEVYNLIADPEDNYFLLLDQGDDPDEIQHYYIEISNEMDRIVLIQTDALYYKNALEQTQIGYLAQEMARERGIKYIIFQTEDGIFFSSKKGAEVYSIDSDEFLQAALESDSIMHRLYQFQGDNVLEMVRPFSSSSYPFGLLRIGLSLERYDNINNSFRMQMIIIALVLLILTILILLYFNSRQKRAAITAEFSQFKTISDRIFDEVKSGIAAVDASGQIIFANDAFYYNSLLNKKEPANWDEAVRSDEWKIDSIKNLQNKSFEKELTVEKGDQKLDLLVAISKIYDENRNFNGFVALVYNITVVKDLQRESSRKERLSEMGNLAAGVAHEIRNPLNTISIASQRLASEFLPEHDKDEYLSFTTQIKSETKRLNEIISRFLELTKKNVDESKNVNISKIVREFVSFIKPESDSLDIEIQSKLGEEIRVNLKEDQLKQVLTNLYNNSKEALGDKNGVIRLSCLSQNGKVHLIFEDNGPGIKDDLKEKVFTPYFTTKDAGTGLGLPTIHRIVIDMGGEIKIEDSELGGAKFLIIF